MTETYETSVPGGQDKSVLTAPFSTPATRAEHPTLLPRVTGWLQSLRTRTRPVLLLARKSALRQGLSESESLPTYLIAKYFLLRAYITDQLRLTRPITFSHAQTRTGHVLRPIWRPESQGSPNFVLFPMINVLPTSTTHHNNHTGRVTVPTKTRSQLAAMSRRKGAQFERHVATAIRPWFPDTTRSRDNGHRTTNYTAPDSGDLAGTGPEFFWSLKNNDGGTNDSASTVGAWFTECQTKAAALHRTGLLVQKRPGYADPLDAWCWLTLGDLTAMTGWSGCPTDVTALPVRMRLGDALAAFARCGYTPAVPEPLLAG